MKKFTAIGVSSGIVAGIWAGASASLGLGTLAGFLAWSTYFAAGGGKKGIKAGLIANLCGICWGFIEAKLSVILGPYVGNILAVALATGVGSAVICWQSKVDLLKFIPGTFIGCTAFFATNLDFKLTLISMIIGSSIGYVSDILVNVLAKEDKDEVQEATTISLKRGALLRKYMK
jgi:hypothetical protein